MRKKFFTVLVTEQVDREAVESPVEIFKTRLDVTLHNMFLVTVL